MKKAKLWKLGLAVTIVFAMLLSSVAGVVAIDGITATWVGNPLDGNIDINITGTAPAQTTFMIFQIPLDAFGDRVVYDDDANLLVYVNQRGDVTTSHRASTAVIGRQNFGLQDNGTFNEALFVGYVGGVTGLPPLFNLRISDTRTAAPAPDLGTVANREWDVDDAFGAALVAPTYTNAAVTVSQSFDVVVGSDEEEDIADWAGVIAEIVSFVTATNWDAPIVATVTWTVTWTTASVAGYTDGVESDDVTFTVTIPAYAGTVPGVPAWGYADDDAALAGTALVGTEVLAVPGTLALEMYDDGNWVAVTIAELLAMPDGDPNVLVRTSVTSTLRTVGGVAQTSTVPAYFVYTPDDIQAVVYTAGEPVPVGDFEVPHGTERPDVLALLPSYVAVTYTSNDGPDIVINYPVTWTWVGNTDYVTGIVTSYAVEAARAASPDYVPGVTDLGAAAAIVVDNDGAGFGVTWAAPGTPDRFRGAVLGRDYLDADDWSTLWAHVELQLVLSGDEYADVVLGRGYVDADDWSTLWAHIELGLPFPAWEGAPETELPILP